MGAVLNRKKMTHSPQPGFLTVWRGLPLSPNIRLLWGNFPKLSTIPFLNSVLPLHIRRMQGSRNYIWSSRRWKLFLLCWLLPDSGRRTLVWFSWTSCSKPRPLHLVHGEHPHCCCRKRPSARGTGWKRSPEWIRPRWQHKENFLNFYRHMLYYIL